MQASSDLSVLDFDIPFSVCFVQAAGIELLTAIGIMATVTWQVLIVGVLATIAAKYVQVCSQLCTTLLHTCFLIKRKKLLNSKFFLWWMKGYYQPSARELMRINGTTKAPIMNYATETSLGVATIRAFNMEERFFQNYLKLVDTDASTFLYSNATLEWLILRTEALQNITLFTAALLLVYQPKGYVAPGTC